MQALIYNIIRMCSEAKTANWERSLLQTSISSTPVVYQVHSSKMLSLVCSKAEMLTEAICANVNVQWIFQKVNVILSVQKGKNAIVAKSLAQT